VSNADPSQAPARRNRRRAAVLGGALAAVAVVAVWSLGRVVDRRFDSSPVVPGGGFQVKGSHRVTRASVSLGIDARGWEVRSGADGTMVLELSDEVGLMSAIALPVSRGQRVGILLSPQGRRAGLCEFPLQRVGKGPPAVAALPASDGWDRVAGSGPASAHGEADPQIWRLVLSVVFSGIRETEDPSILAYETKLSFGGDIRYNWHAISGESVHWMQIPDPRGVRLEIVPSAARAVATTAWIPPRTVGVVSDADVYVKSGLPGACLLEFEWHDTSPEVVGRWRLNAILMDKETRPWTLIKSTGHPFVVDKGETSYSGEATSHGGGKPNER